MTLPLPHAAAALFLVTPAPHRARAAPFLGYRRAEAAAVRAMASGSQHSTIIRMSHRMARSLFSPPPRRSGIPRLLAMFGPCRLSVVKTREDTNESTYQVGSTDLFSSLLYVGILGRSCRTRVPGNTGWMVARSAHLWDQIFQAAFQ